MPVNSKWHAVNSTTPWLLPMSWLNMSNVKIHKYFAYPGMQNSVQHSQAAQTQVGKIRPQDSKLKSLKSNLLQTDGQYEDMQYS
jgi:hypothetical protein